VIKAREVQSKRFKSEAEIHSNAQMNSQQVREICKIGDDGKWILEMAMDKQRLSARAYDRILKVARTIADLDGSKSIELKHLSEAIQFRTLDSTASSVASVQELKGYKMGLVS
jgi:magnesium chelatase family protein